jgi:hypothetical protein
MKRKREGFFDEFSRIFGFIVLIYAIIILLSTPSFLLAKTITTLDTELSQASTDATFVRAKMDFGNNEHMRAFPNNISGWEGSDYNTTRVAESLGADVMLMRSYINPETFQPVIFLIIQSTNRSTFHPPVVCYPALGYTIEEEGKAAIPVRNISWIEEPLFGVPATKARYSNVTLPVKKLVVVKQSGEKVTERKVVLYFYVKDNPFTSDTFTLIRVSALAPTEGSYDGFLNLTAEFMGNTLPCMFELRKEELIFFSLFASLAGKVLVGLMLLVPLPIIFYPEIKRLRKV